MNKSFQFETHTFSKDTEKAHLITVEINIYARHEDDAEFEIESIWDEDAMEAREIEQFSEVEQSQIEAQCNALTNEHCYEAWQDAQIAKAEAWNDRDR